MTQGRGGSRILIYSHDSFGLGHLRRCRTIAHALAERYDDVSVLILSGSPIIGSFDFHDRVDFIRVPGVIKLHNGEYTSLKLPMDIEETVRMRASIIQHTAATFDPDILIVDKEPLGLRGEVGETLRQLKSAGTRLVLGLRDVMDEPSLLVPEWERKKVMPALHQFYDEIWVYGLSEICDPLSGFELSEDLAAKIIYTGYLPREIEPVLPSQLPAIRHPYILVTTGGGGDGEGLIDWVIKAYELDPTLPYPALLVLGPFMQPDRQAEFRERARQLKHSLKVITFDAHLESIANRAIGVVAMGGYNTFCEILSLDKRALIVPRQWPRREQFIRASRAEELGLIRMLTDESGRDPEIMAKALHALPHQRRPSEVVVPGLMDGLKIVERQVEPWLGARRREEAREPQVVRPRF